MLAQVPRLQTEPINRLDHRPEQMSEFPCYLLHFVVEGLLAKVLVDVPHQMNEAPLLNPVD
jgi:hypothetical protein